MFKITKEKKYTHIFFDIFDTILSRKVQPEYTKKIWCNYIVKTFELNINMEDLYKKRNHIEYSLGEKNHELGNDYEFTYEDMIKKLYKDIKLKEIDYKTFYRICVDTEISIESNVLYLNEDILELIKELKKLNKKIICVSDMYLSKEMIDKIFDNLEISKYIDKVYVSCEYLKNKKSGDLYDLVINDLKINYEKCIMIGDNENSDYNVPNQKKIKSILLDRKDKYDFYEKYINDNSPKIIKNNIIELSNINTDNFEHCIFSLYNFIERLYYKLILNNKDEVFFLSREGEYLKKLFDYYVENTFNKKIKSHYLYVSRKATYLPSLKPLEKEEFTSLLRQYSYISIYEFLKSLNFEENEIKKIKKSLNIKNIEEKIGYFNESKEFKKLKKDKVFKDIYEKNRIEQCTNFKKYINAKTKSKDLVLVDIGWNGSIQNNIQNILGENYIIDGYYYGLIKMNQNDTSKKTGLIFTNTPNFNKEYQLYSENRTIFEIILGASHGSANKYIIDKGKIKVDLFKKSEEEKIFKDVIKPIQNTMFELYKSILKNTQNKYYDNLNLNKIINKIHFNMVYNPTKEQLKFFNKIYHYENFGVFQFTEFNKKKRISYKEYIKENIKSIKNYNCYFYDSFWPILKLYNNRLYLQSFVYRIVKYRKFKKHDII